ncbi:MAG: N-acetylmuramoyl-L-alanine amidase [Verrucomicrobiota bacterium]
MHFLRVVALIFVAVFLSQCGSPPALHEGKHRGAATMGQMSRAIGLRSEILPKGVHARKFIRPMKPRYITVHSTQNYTADAAKHSLALRRGALRSKRTRTGNRIGYLIWHFTIDDHQCIQHLPCSEQGEHADYHGPGNRLSIGIEMCENRGNNRRETVEHTAMLCAILMKRYNIPVRNVVPHYHWPRRGRQKNCPHFLLDNGRPGRKWNGFLQRVRFHRNRIAS